MRSIQNTTLQGFNIPFSTPRGLFELYLRPRSTIIVPDTYSSKILENLIKRRMVKVTRVK
jgi:hypothetical protein